MKVKMTTALTTNNMVLSFGETVELEKKFAESLVKANMAILVKGESKAPEKQTPIEEAPVKRGRKKKVVN